MAKISGLSIACTIQDSSAMAQTLSNDIGDFTLPITFATQDVTGIDKAAMERLALLTDLKASIKGFFNNASSHIHPVLSTGQTVARQVVITIVGSGGTLTFTGLIDNYTITRAATGALTTSASISLSNGTAPAWS